MGNGHMGTPPLNRMTDRHLGKHYLPEAWFAASSEEREDSTKFEEQRFSLPCASECKKVKVH